MFAPKRICIRDAEVGESGSGSFFTGVGTYISLALKAAMVDVRTMLALSGSAVYPATGAACLTDRLPTTTGSSGISTPSVVSYGATGVN